MASLGGVELGGQIHRQNMKTKRVEPLEGIWLLSALLVPLWIDLWGSHPFDLAKSLLLRALVWIGVAIWLLTPGRGRPLPSVTRWATVALAGVWLAATATGANSGLSWWGSVGRNLGASSLIGLLLLFVLVATRLRGPEQARRLGWALTLPAVPITLLGLLQAAGLAALPVINNNPSPILATLGRADFVAAYLALLLPFVAALRLDRARTAPGRALMGLSLAMVTVLWLTRARAAWLSAAAGMALFVLFLAWPRLDRGRRRRLVAALGLLTAVAGAAGLAWVASADPGAVAARRTIWEAIWDLIRARPWLGYGPDSLELIFPTVYPPPLVTYQGRGLLVDRAHNWLLDVWVTTGLLGLLAWIALWLAGFRAGWQALRRAPELADRRLLAAALAAVLGNVAGTLASFDTIATATVTWLLLGLLVAAGAAPLWADRALHSAICNPQSDDRRSPPARARTIAVLRPLAILLVTLVAALIIDQTVVRPLQADNADWDAKQAARAGDWEAATTAAVGAVERWPVEFAYYLDAGWICILRVERGAGTPACLVQAEGLLIQARRLRPDDYRVHAALGELYTLWGSRLDPALFARAHAAYEAALTIAPNLAALHLAQGLVFVQEADWPAAVDAFRQTVALDDSDARALLYLGDAELARGQPAAAILAYEEALRRQPELNAAASGLARCYEALGQPEEAARWHSLAIEP